MRTHARFLAIAALVFAGSTVVSVPGATKVEFGSAHLPFLSAGDWDGFWSGFGLVSDERIRRDLEAANGPLALAAMTEGALPYDIPVSRITAPAMLYTGSEEIFAHFMPADAEALGAPLRILDGRDHAGTFLSRSEVLEFVRPHLERSRST